MLTIEQERYLLTIPEAKIAEIRPWDPRSVKVAKKIIEQIQKADPQLQVIYMGASALQLPGVNDIDLTVTCPKEDFGQHWPKLKPLLGKPLKIGKENIRWEGVAADGFHADVHMTDPRNPFLAEHIRLFEFLKKKPELLEQYKALKESSNNLPYREYQRRKYEFYNKVLKAF